MDKMKKHNSIYEQVIRLDEQLNVLNELDKLTVERIIENNEYLCKIGEDLDLTMNKYKSDDDGEMNEVFIENYEKVRECMSKMLIELIFN